MEHQHNLGMLTPASYEMYCLGHQYFEVCNWYQNKLLREACRKKNRGFSEFGTKGGRVSDLNHYFEQQWNSEKGEGGGRKRYL